MGIARWIRSDLHNSQSNFSRLPVPEFPYQNPPALVGHLECSKWESLAETIFAPVNLAGSTSIVMGVFIRLRR